MPRVKTKPFQVTRIPALNGAWIDIHLSESGNICLQLSGYAEVDPKVLTKTIRRFCGKELLVFMQRAASFESRHLKHCQFLIMNKPWHQPALSDACE